MSKSIVSIEHVKVRKGALDAQVVVPCAFLTTDKAPAGFDERLAKRLPGLDAHLCFDKAADEDESLTAHLFEHMVLQVLKSMDENDTADHVYGCTVWREKPTTHGRYRITVSLRDDLVGLAALKQAQEILQEAWWDSSAG